MGNHIIHVAVKEWLSALGGLSCIHTFGSPDFMGHLGLSVTRSRVVGSPHLMGQLGLSVTRSRVVGSLHLMGLLGLSVTRTLVGLSVTHLLGGLSFTQSLGGCRLSTSVLPWSQMLPLLMMSSQPGCHTPYVSLPHRWLLLWSLSLPVGPPLHQLLLHLLHHHLGLTPWLRLRRMLPLRLHLLLLPR